MPRQVKPVPPYQRGRRNLRVSIVLAPETRAQLDAIMAKSPDARTTSAAIRWAAAVAAERLPGRSSDANKETPMDATKTVAVWLDETSEGTDAAKWIVSLDDDLGSDTVSAHDNKADAVTAAMRLAAKRGLKLVCR